MALIPNWDSTGVLEIGRLIFRLFGSQFSVVARDLSSAPSLLDLVNSLKNPWVPNDIDDTIYRRLGGLLDQCTTCNKELFLAN